MSLLIDYSGKNGYDARLAFCEDFPFAAAVLEYVNCLQMTTQWFVDSCAGTPAGEYFVFFKSYRPEEYQNRLLVIHVVQKNGQWSFSVHKVAEG